MEFVADKLTEENGGKEFRYGIPREYKSLWRIMVARTGLPQTQVLHRLVQFLLEQDDVAQAMVLKTVRPSEDLVELLVKRMAQRRKGYAGTHTHIDAPSPLPPRNAGGRRGRKKRDANNHTQP
jgi:hypothetical protein